MKILITSLVFLQFLTSCDLFGWDSSGGIGCNEEDVTCLDTSIGTSIKFLILKDEAYPFQGSALIQESSYGDFIEVTGLEFKSNDEFDDLIDEDILKITKEACDQTAVNLDSVVIDANEALVDWTNQDSLTGTLSISRDTFSDSGYRVIDCIN